LTFRFAVISLTADLTKPVYILCLARVTLAITGIEAALSFRQRIISENAYSNLPNGDKVPGSQKRPIRAVELSQRMAANPAVNRSVQQEVSTSVSENRTKYVFSEIKRLH
jgi:hypothetical protein